MRLSVVIPALNEEEGIGSVIKQIPTEKLKTLGYDVEILVVDNNSTDNTAVIARRHGAKVIVQPIRGYGNAYKAGFANATGDIIATGDADMTYPFDNLPEILELMQKEDYDFITTDRMSTLEEIAMSRLHVIGNNVLSTAAKILFDFPFKDSQSGMWIFKRSIWPHLSVVSGGMPFSQELKIEALAKGYKCVEIPIDYRARVGEVKNTTWGDGLRNITQLLKKRLVLRKHHSEATARVE